MFRQVGTGQVRSHRLGQRTDGGRVEVAVQLGVGVEQRQQPLELRPVELLVDRHVAGHRADHQVARVVPQYRRQQVVVVGLVGLHDHRLRSLRRLRAEPGPQEAQAAHLERQRLEEGQVDALVRARRVDAFRQQVQVRVGEEVEVDPLVPQPVGAGGQRQLGLGLPPGPDLRVEHQRHPVLVEVVQLLKPVSGPEVVEAAVRGGDHGHPVALVGVLPGQVPDQRGESAAHHPDVEAHTFEGECDDVHRQAFLSRRAGRDLSAGPRGPGPGRAGRAACRRPGSPRR